MVINNMYKNLGLAALVITALIGCGEDPVPADCPAGQIKAQVGTVEACFTSCMVSTDCAATERCSSTTGAGVCLPRTTPPPMDMGMDMPVTPTDMPVTPTDMPVTPTDMPADMPATDMPTDMPMGDPDIQTCLNAADKLFKSCLTSQCGAALLPATKMQFDNQYTLFINGGTANGMTVAPCSQGIKQDPQFRSSIEQIAGSMVTCAIIKEQIYCDPESFDLGDECTCPVIEPPTNLGAACSDGQMSTTCDGGSLQGVCTSDDPADPGICLAIDCDLPANPMANTYYFGGSCGAINEGACLSVEQQGQIFGLCIETCQADADCEQSPATGCNILGMLSTGESVGVCEDKCAADADCVGQDANGNPVQGTCNAMGFCDFQ